MELSFSSGVPQGIIECRYAVNTNSAGASISADTWTALAITEFLDTGSFCSVSAGVMTLASGTYRGYISCTGNRETGGGASEAILRLRNTSDSASPIVSEERTITAWDGSYTMPIAKFGSFIIGSSKNFELQLLYDVAGTIGHAQSSLSDADQHVLATIYLEKLA